MTDRKPAEQTTTGDEKPAKVEIEAISGPIDPEILRKLKDLCRRYGPETVKQMVNDAA